MKKLTGWGILLAVITAIAIGAIMYIRSVPVEEHFHSLFVGIWEYRNPSGNIDLEVFASGSVRQFTWVNSVILEMPDDVEILLEDGQLHFSSSTTPVNPARAVLVPFYWGPNKLMIFESHIDSFCQRYAELDTPIEWEIQKQLLFTRLGSLRETNAEPMRFDGDPLC